MDIFGQYKVHDVMLADEDGVRFVSAADFAAMDPEEVDEDLRNMLISILDVTPEALNIYFVLTPEQKEEAIAEGWEVDENNRVLAERFPLEEFEGGLRYSTGEMDGQPLWTTLELDGEGFINVNGMLRYERV